MSSSSQVCELCAVELPNYPILSGEHAFCCPGCQAVHSILEAKGERERFEEHPIFIRAVESGLISNPKLLEEIRQKQQATPHEERQKLYLEIEEMWCPSCAEIISLLLLKKEGVVNCVVDYATDLACIEFAPMKVGKESLKASIRQLGYGVCDLQSRSGKAVSRGLFLRLGVAGFCALNLMMLSYPIYASYFYGDDSGLVETFSWLSLALSLPVVSFCAWPIWKRFWVSLKVGFFGMETLVAIGVGAAFGLSGYHLSQGIHHVYFDSMSMIIFFVLLGKVIESKAKFSAKDSLFRLTRALPRRGRKRFEGEEKFVALKEVEVGDVLVAHSGEKLVLDGVVVEGKGAADESLMTGEALPVVKECGDGILGGSCLKSGSLAYRVTAQEAQSVLHRLIDMVEQGVEKKKSLQPLLDGVIRWFVPVIVAVAGSVSAGLLWRGASLEEAVVRGVSILLISCPCAVGIAAPLAESLLMSGLASLGAIVRNRGCLRVLGTETVWVFDKTGTLTEGRFTVLKGAEVLSTFYRSILQEMTRHSIHPIALSMRDHLDEKELALDLVEELAGLGIQAKLHGKRYLFGSEKLLRQQGLSSFPPYSGSHTVVHFAEEQEVLATIEMGDRLREEAAEVMAGLKGCVLATLSGDREEVVARVSKRLGISQWKGGCSPLDKKEWISQFQFQGAVVAMVGDGINDALCLTEADVGISVVSATDISIQVSDLLLTSERLSVLPQIRDLAQKGRKVVSQNLFWAFSYNVFGVGLAVMGYLSPLFATFAMIASSLAVTVNALRLKRVTRSFPETELRP